MQLVVIHDDDVMVMHGENVVADDDNGDDVDVDFGDNG